jgi:hypothetical protein
MACGPLSGCLSASKVVGMRRQDVQQLTVFGHDREIHDTLR